MFLKNFFKRNLIDLTTEVINKSFCSIHRRVNFMPLYCLFGLSTLLYLINFGNSLGIDGVGEEGNLPGSKV